MNLPQRIKYSIKCIIAYLLFYSGVIFLIKAVKLKNKAVVLMYHRILDEKELPLSFSHPGIIVQKANFAKQLKFLRRHFHILSENAFLDRLERHGSFRSSSCLITFDDGWQDNYNNAYPILREMQLPAIIFLAAGFIGKKQEFWQEKLAAVLFEIRQRLEPNDRTILQRYGIDGITEMPAQEAKTAIRQFVTLQKDLDAAKLHHLIEDISKHSRQHQENKVDSFMNWDQVKEMACNTISFGSHSVHHHILTKVSLQTAAKEIVESRQYVKKMTGISPKIFCYPNGNHSDELAGLVAASGYRAAFTTTSGMVDHGCNRYTLRRINIHDDASRSLPLFMMRILGIF
jgi:peptidoglycan/xylan/chitin deacetylase (PgdA/CDA1 family)